MTDIWKAAGRADGPVTAGEEDLAAINRLAKGTLSAEEVYIFPLRLCDNEVDRDYERFSVAALQGLGELFVGKSGIFDHNWSAGGQTARIYRTEVVREDSATVEGGGPYCYLKAWAYMLRSEKNQDLIQEIEAGIKKEVSIGCSVGSKICSICGRDTAQAPCEHIPGREYDGMLCYRTLEHPQDAYEWSFVAVPAQPQAGVIRKERRSTAGTLKDFLRQEGDPSYLEELSRLEKEAALGRTYLEDLRRELVRLAGLADQDLDCQLFARVAQRLEETELLELTKVYRRRAEDRLSGAPQLCRSPRTDSGEAFLV